MRIVAVAVGLLITTACSRGPTLADLRAPEVLVTVTHDGDATTGLDIVVTAEDDPCEAPAELVLTVNGLPEDIERPEGAEACVVAAAAVTGDLTRSAPHETTVVLSDDETAWTAVFVNLQVPPDTKLASDAATVSAGDVVVLSVGPDTDLIAFGADVFLESTGTQPSYGAVPSDAVNANQVTFTVPSDIAPGPYAASVSRTDVTVPVDRCDGLERCAAVRTGDFDNEVPLTVE